MPYYVYILASRTKRLYTGMTNSLESRVFQHKAGSAPGFATKYNINKLVYIEEFPLVRDAIAREKQIKDWRREKRVALIESLNPEWDDIAERWYPGQEIPRFARNDTFSISRVLLNPRYNLRMDPHRCGWTNGASPLMLEYHDAEWGVPSHDDRHLFEMLTLEGAQAGLSWNTILNKREGYRRAFRDFDPAKVARFGAKDVERLLGDAGIVRNRMKIEATIANAKTLVAVQREFGSFDAYIWQLAGGKPRKNRIRSMRALPAKTEQSDAMSKELKKRGFKFVGSTICYAFMQATGMVNDHELRCFRCRAV